MALTIKYILTDFAQWTAIPGPVQIISAFSSLTRFLWIIIWLILFGVFIYQFYLIVAKLLETSTIIETALIFGVVVIIL